MATVPSAPSPGGYQRYKNDTNAFLTWLLRAATSCGYQVRARFQADTILYSSGC